MIVVIIVMTVVIIVMIVVTVVMIVVVIATGPPNELLATNDALRKEPLGFVRFWVDGPLANQYVCLELDLQPQTPHILTILLMKWCFLRARFGPPKSLDISLRLRSS